MSWLFTACTLGSVAVMVGCVAASWRDEARLLQRRAGLGPELAAAIARQVRAGGFFV